MKAGPPRPLAAMFAGACRSRCPAARAEHWVAPPDMQAIAPPLADLHRRRAVRRPVEAPRTRPAPLFRPGHRRSTHRRREHTDVQTRISTVPSFNWGEARQDLRGHYAPRLLFRAGHARWPASRPPRRSSSQPRHRDGRIGAEQATELSAGRSSTRRRARRRRRGPDGRHRAGACTAAPTACCSATCGAAPTGTLRDREPGDAGRR